jgi:outer membrane biosynthesis protein TonB
MSRRKAAGISSYAESDDDFNDGPAKPKAAEVTQPKPKRGKVKKMDEDFAAMGSESSDDDVPFGEEESEEDEPKKKKGKVVSKKAPAKPKAAKSKEPAKSRAAPSSAPSEPRKVGLGRSAGETCRIF